MMHPPPSLPPPPAKRKKERRRKKVVVRNGCNEEGCINVEHGENCLQMCARAVLKQRWSPGLVSCWDKDRECSAHWPQVWQMCDSAYVLKVLTGTCFVFLTHVQSSWVILTPLVSERFCAVVWKIKTGDKRVVCCWCVLTGCSPLLTHGYSPFLTHGYFHHFSLMAIHRFSLKFQPHINRVVFIWGFIVCC